MNKKRKNLRRGFIRLTLVLSIIGATVGCLIGTDLATHPDPMLNFIPDHPQYFRYGFKGFLLGFVSVWVLYLLIGYAIIPVIRFVKSGFEAK